MDFFDKEVCTRIFQIEILFILKKVKKNQDKEVKIVNMTDRIMIAITNINDVSNLEETFIEYSKYRKP